MFGSVHTRERALIGRNAQPEHQEGPGVVSIAFLEKKIVTIIDIINEEGKKKFHAEYEYAGAV